MMLNAPNRRMDMGSKSGQLIATLDLSYELMLELQNNTVIPDIPYWNLFAILFLSIDIPAKG